MMERLKADFDDLQTEVAKMRSELDGVDKLFSICQSLKKNVEDLNQGIINKVDKLTTAFDTFKSQMIKQQVSMKKDIADIRKEMEKAKKEVEGVMELPRSNVQCTRSLPEFSEK